MFDFTSQLDDFFLALYVHLTSDPVNESFTAAVLLAVFLIVLVLHKKAAAILKHLGREFNSYGLFLIGLVFPLIYLVIMKAADTYFQGKFAVILFQAVAYFYLGFYLVKNLLKPLKISIVPWNFISYILLFLTVFFFLLLSLNAHFFHNTDLQEVFSIAYKISAILLIYMFLLKALRFLSDYLPERLRLTKNILQSLLSVVSVLYIIVAALWLFKIIGFASSLFVGGVAVFVAILGYGLLKAYTASYLGPKTEGDESSYKGLLNSIASFLNLLLIYVLYIIFKLFFNLGHVTHYLSEAYLINTGVIIISVFSLIAGVFIFFFLLSLLGIVKHTVYFYNMKLGKELEAASLRSLVSNLGLLIVIIITLSELGLTWKALLPIAGALGIGIGIGLQSIMNNYLSGFILLFSKRLKIGDIIEIEGNAGRAIGNTLETIYGRVVSVDTFSSVVTTTDGIEIVVPNSQFIDKQMVNYSLSDYRIRVRIPFGVSYSADPNTVKDILLKVASENTQILKTPEPGLWFTEYADSALVFYLLCWVNIKDIWKINPVISDIYFKAWYELEKAGVVIPFPQRDVWFKNNLKVEIENELGEHFQKKPDTGGGE